MPYYHATTADRIPSILRHGLGGIDTGPRAEDCERGVYLASNPLVSLAIALEHAIKAMDEESAPREALDAIRVIVVDDVRLTAWRLRPDPHVDEVVGSWLYDGVIDITGLPILTLDETKAGAAALLGLAA